MAGSGPRDIRSTLTGKGEAPPSWPIFRTRSSKVDRVGGISRRDAGVDVCLPLVYRLLVSKQKGDIPPRWGCDADGRWAMGEGIGHNRGSIGEPPRILGRGAFGSNPIGDHLIDSSSRRCRTLS